MSDVLSREEYARQMRVAGFYPDRNYGPSGSAHPYDFEPDPEASTPEEMGRYGEACAKASLGEWKRTTDLVRRASTSTIATWGWGIVRYWFTREVYEEMIGPIPSDSDEVQKGLWP